MGHLAGPCPFENRISSVTSSFFVSRRGSAIPLLLAGVLALGPPAAEAQAPPQGRQTVIRDTEIEALLRDYARPILEVAGLSSRGIEIVLVQDRSFNAFVASGRRMVVFTGTILQAKTPNEVIGVIAHETGHLAGGHLEKLHNEIARAQAIGAAIGLLGIAGMAAGVASGSSSSARMGTAATTMSSGVATRTLLSYKRAQEYAADRAALTYLSATHQSARGMVTTFQRFADQQLVAAQYADPYALSHPMARDRLEQLETSARASPYYETADSDALSLRHEMVRAKIAGFTEAPNAVARRYPRSDESMPAQYARAIVAYRTGSTRDAVRAADALIARVPNYAYFHELKGQILLEAGKAKEAIPPLRQAVALASDAGLIRIMLGSAELAAGNLDAAVADLRKGLAEEPLTPLGYRNLATAYQQQGKVAEAELATAEGLLVAGAIEDAKGFARRAQAKFATGTPGWLKADDIIGYEAPKG
jgi:predicted Zn-dependent protease